MGTATCRTALDLVDNELEPLFRVTAGGHRRRGLRREATNVRPPASREDVLDRDDMEFQHTAFRGLSITLMLM